MYAFFSPTRGDFVDDFCIDLKDVGVFQRCMTASNSDPDFLVWRNGQLFVLGFGCEPNNEVTTTNGMLSAGDYVIDLNDFRHSDQDSPAAYPARVCFDVTAN